MQKSLKIGTAADQVVYTGLFLTGKALKWFKPYLTEIQINKITTTNQEVKYMFLNWDGFASQLTQIFGNLKAVIITKQKLLELTQKGSTTDYTMLF